MKARIYLNDFAPWLCELQEEVNLDGRFQRPEMVQIPVMSEGHPYLVTCKVGSIRDGAFEYFEHRRGRLKDGGAIVVKKPEEQA